MAEFAVRQHCPGKAAAGQIALVEDEIATTDLTKKAAFEDPDAAKHQTIDLSSSKDAASDCTVGNLNIAELRVGERNALKRRQQNGAFPQRRAVKYALFDQATCESAVCDVNTGKSQFE